MRSRHNTAPQFVVARAHAPTPQPLLATDYNLAPTVDALRTSRAHNSALIERPLDARIRDECASLCAAGPFRRELRVSLASVAIDALVDERFSAELRAFLAVDVARWASVYCDLAGAARCKLTLASVWTDSCRKFHADFVALRLLCTYAGPGTEFVADEHVVRDVELDTSKSVEAIAEANAQMITAPTMIRHAREGDVLLLKGERWPDNHGRGAMHRSPPIEAHSLRRLVLTIDSLPTHAHAHG